jgi:hypothetical protein
MQKFGMCLRAIDRLNLDEKTFLNFFSGKFIFNPPGPRPLFKMVRSHHFEKLPQSEQTQSPESWTIREP